MGISIELYRARIGGFLPKQRNTSPLHRHFINIKGTTVKLACRIIVIMTLVMLLSGDIEQNPGPPTGARMQTRQSSTSEIIREEPHNAKLAELIENMGLEIRQEICQEIRDLKDTLGTSVKHLQKDVKELKEENQKLKKTVRRLEEESRQNNLIFFDVSEDEHETWEAPEEKIRAKLNLSGFEANDDNQLPITKTYRMGKRTRNKNRPILCKFTNLKDRNKILQVARLQRQAEEVTINVAEDFTEEVRATRKSLKSLISNVKEITGEQQIYITHDKLKIGSQKKSLDQVRELIANKETEEATLEGEDGATGGPQNR